MYIDNFRPADELSDNPVSFIFFLQDTYEWIGIPEQDDDEEEEEEEEEEKEEEERDRAKDVSFRSMEGENDRSLTPLTITTQSQRPPKQQKNVIIAS